MTDFTFSGYSDSIEENQEGGGLVDFINNLFGNTNVSESEGGASKVTYKKVFGVKNGGMIPKGKFVVHHRNQEVESFYDALFKTRGTFSLNDSVYTQLVSATKIKLNELSQQIKQIDSTLISLNNEDLEVMKREGLLTINEWTTEKKAGKRSNTYEFYARNFKVRKGNEQTKLQNKKRVLRNIFDDSSKTVDFNILYTYSITSEVKKEVIELLKQHVQSLNKMNLTDLNANLIIFGEDNKISCYPSSSPNSSYVLMYREAGEYYNVGVKSGLFSKSIVNYFKDENAVKSASKDLVKIINSKCSSTMAGGGSVDYYKKYMKYKQKYMDLKK